MLSVNSWCTRHSTIGFAQADPVQGESSSRVLWSGAIPGCDVNRISPVRVRNDELGVIALHLLHGNLLICRANSFTEVLLMWRRSATSFLLLVLFASPALRADKGWANAVNTRGGGLVATVVLNDGAVSVVTSETAVNTFDANGHFRWRESLALRDAMFATANQDGGLVVGGMRARSFQGSAVADLRTEKTWLVKLGSDGKLVWAKEQTTDENSQWRAGIAGPKNTTFLVGSVGNAAAFAQIGADGHVDFVKTYHVSGGREHFSSVAAVPSGGFVAAGYGGCGSWLVRLRPDASVEWQNCYALGAGSFRDVIATTDGGFLAVGRAREGGSPYRIWLVKTAADGSITWQKHTRGDHDDQAYRVVENKDGYLVLAYTGSFGVTSDQGPMILTLSKDGTLKRQLVQGGPDDAFYRELNDTKQLALARDGGAFVAFAPADKDMRVFHFDSAGSVGNTCALFAASSAPLQSGAVTPVQLAIESSSVTMKSEPFTVNVTELDAPLLSTLCNEPEQAKLVEALHKRAETVTPPTDVPPQMRQYTAEISSLRTDITRMLHEKQFESLDTLERKIRLEQPFDIFLPWKITTYYQTLDQLTFTTPIRDLSSLSVFDEWMKQRPQSAAARIAKASSLLNYAQAARGGRTADTVTEKGAQGYDDLRRQVLQVLEGGRDLAGDDPHYYDILLRANEGEGGKAIVDKATSVIAYPQLFSTWMHFALPQWGGSADDRNRILDYAVAHTRDQAGNELYAALASQAAGTSIPGQPTGANPYEALGFSWPRIRDAYQEWVDKHPDWPTLWNVFAYEAWRARDTATLTRLFARPQLAWTEDSQNIWGSKSAWEDAKEYTVKK
jgi:hypothetical protein